MRRGHQLVVDLRFHMKDGDLGGSFFEMVRKRIKLRARMSPLIDDGEEDVQLLSRLPSLVFRSERRFRVRGRSSREGAFPLLHPLPPASASSSACSHVSAY